MRPGHGRHLGASVEHPKYLSKVLHNTQKRGIVHHLAELKKPLHQWSSILRGATNQLSHLFPRDPVRRGVLCESPLYVAAQRVDVDALHRAPVSLVALVHPATSARLSQIDPVR